MEAYDTFEDWFKDTQKRDFEQKDRPILDAWYAGTTWCQKEMQFQIHLEQKTRFLQGQIEALRAANKDLRECLETITKGQPDNELVSKVLGKQIGWS